MLGLLKRTFSSTNSIKTKKQLYLSLVRSQLSYGSQLWRPMLLKDILLSIEKIQRRATKFILPQTTSPMTYKERLVYLNILPLMYHLELANVMFFVNSYKNPSSRFNISKRMPQLLRGLYQVVRQFISKTQLLPHKLTPALLLQSSA